MLTFENIQINLHASLKYQVAFFNFHWEQLLSCCMHKPGIVFEMPRSSYGIISFRVFTACDLILSKDSSKAWDYETGYCPL